MRYKLLTSFENMLLLITCEFGVFGIVNSQKRY